MLKSNALPSNTMNTDLLLLSLAWAVVSSYGAAYAWTHSPRIIRGIATRLSEGPALRQRIRQFIPT